jgi:RHS repeat-associated protein
MYLAQRDALSLSADIAGATSLRAFPEVWGAGNCALTSQLTRGYTAQEMLDNQCLINMNARVYDPTLAQFQSADSIVPDPLYGQAYNRNACVLGNPLAFTDPRRNGPVVQADFSFG